MNNDLEYAKKKANEYIDNPHKVINVIRGTNRKKKTPKARKLSKGISPSVNDVRNKFFGRIGAQKSAFYELLCEELNYCGAQFELTQKVIEKIILFLLAMTAPIFILLAELIFLLQKHFMNKFCYCD